MVLFYVQRSGWAKKNRGLSARDSRFKPEDYFLAGCDCWAGFWPESTEPPAAAFLPSMIESVIEVSMKMTAHQVVSLVMMLAALRGPKAVWLPWPPKAAARSPLCALC